MKKLVLLPYLFSVLFLYAQEPSLYFEKLNVSNGLSHNKVNCILQDKRGFIWLGTDDGLNRYDGKRFFHFRAKPNDTLSISGNIITDLLEDKEGKIWITTRDGGLTGYDYKLAPALQFRQYRHNPARASIPTNNINSITEDQHGFLWLGTSGFDVIRFDKKTGKFSPVTNGRKTIIDLASDKEGKIWVGRQGGGLMKIDPSTLVYSEDERYRDLYAKLPHVTITSIFRDRYDDMWFGSWDKNLYRQSAVSGKNVFNSAAPSSFLDDEVLSFAEDKSGRLWIGGKEKGLQVYDRRTGQFYHYAYDPSKEGSISDNRINCIFTDRQGRIWLGTNKGVCINNPEKQQFSQTFLRSNSGSPVSIYDFYEDDEGNLLIGTDQGIYIRSAQGKISHRPIRYKGNALHATHFYKDDDGRVFLGTDYSLFYYDPGTGQLQLLPNTDKDGVMNHILDSRVVSVMRHNIQGRPVLLASPYGHFFAYYDFAQQRWISRLDSSSNIVKNLNIQDNLVRRFYKSANGMLWIATEKSGLGVWSARTSAISYLTNDPSNPASIPSNHVYDMVEDRSGNLWVSTFGGGLSYLDVASSKFIQVPASNNLVEGLQTDQHGNVWMISNGHVQKYDPRRKTFSSYNLPDLEKTGGVKGRIFRDRKGRFYMGGMNYFISFHPDSIREAKSNPQVILTDFQIFNSSFSHLLLQKEIRLNYKDNYFAFEFTAPHFSEGNIHYSYKLEGFDKDWIDAGERNYVSYPNLEGGSYVFMVRATNTPGVWTRDYASARIRIIPPYWKRIWFYILCASLLAITIYFVYRYRINELLKRQAIRNRIAQDLHDNVGSTLSSISVYSQVAKIYHHQHKENELYNALEKISATSSEMISELNDTVWAINPRNDNMHVILQRMDSFAKPLLAAQGTQFTINYDPGIRFLNLEMEKRKNFYLVFKEAINNAIKYAEAKKFNVTIRQKGNILLMKMTDDGKGFDMAKTSEGYKSSDVFGGGNGLKNMQLRAREMKGSLKIYSEGNKGTTVELQFPIT